MLAAGCSSSNAIKEGTATAVTPVAELPNPDPRAAVGTVKEAYYIGPRDKIDVFVYQLPEMTRTVEVDAAGEVQLPFVGTIDAAGKTAVELRDEIATRLSEDYLQNPQVTVAVSAALAQQVTVEGAVGAPGVYGIAGETSLIQALAMARGTSNIANERVVAIFRTIDNQRMAAVFDVERIRRGQMADPQVFGNDIIVVERSRGKVLLRDVLGLTPLLGVFRTVDIVL